MSTLKLVVNADVGTPIVNTALYFIVSREANFRTRIGTITARSSDGRTLTAEIDDTAEGRAVAAQIRSGKTINSWRHGIHGGLVLVLDLDTTATTGPAPRSTDPNPLAKYGFGPRPKVDTSPIPPTTPRRR